MTNDYSVNSTQAVIHEPIYDWVCWQCRYHHLEDLEKCPYCSWDRKNILTLEYYGNYTEPQVTIRKNS